MDLKKVFDQTVRELKREVNKKVLKVPEIEVKVLEATSNEPWGPHGTIMADIAQATRNYNDYQLIMTVLYKRLNDTGRNWRHVYKSLTVLEYLVANGSERVIDELREHTYHIQTLVDFQYMEASGKDQGINVRKKAQSLVSLINDKERIREVRQKANANRDKYRGVSSTGMSFRPSTYSSTGGGYNDRDDDRYGGSYGGSRGGRDDYDSYGGGSRDGDRYRDDDRSGRDKDRYRDDGYGGDRDRNIDDYSTKGSFNDKYESGATSDRDRDRGYDDDDRYSSRCNMAPISLCSSDGRQSNKAKGAPPAYEDTVQTDDQEDDRGSSKGVAAAVATTQSNQAQAAVSTVEDVPSKPGGGGAYFASQVANDEDDFDPRGAFSATTSSASQPKDDFFGETAPIVPTSAPLAVSKSTGGIEDLFGDVGFEVVPVPATVSMQAPSGDLFGASAFQAAPSSAPDMFGAPALQAPPPPSIPGLFPAPPAYQPPILPANSATGESFGAFGSGGSNGNAVPSSASGSIFPPPQSAPTFDFAPSNGGGFSQGSTVLQGQSYSNQSVGSTHPSSNVQSYNNNQPFGHSQSLSSQQSQLGSTQAQPSTNGSTLQPQQQPKKTFAPPKSTLWTDTLSTGLVDLNIAGPKVNPLADLGIQLTDASLRNELWGGSENKRKDEKKSTYGASSMGQAMGAGSGLGRAGASVLPSPPLPPPSAMNVRMGMTPGMAPGMGMMAPQMGGNPGMGMGMGVNLGMNLGMNPGMNMGMNPGMNMGVGQGMGMGMAPNLNMGMGQGGPNMGMGIGGYTSQQYAGYR
ncbi:unnamed protein product [Sphagnum balticum]